MGQVVSTFAIADILPTITVLEGFWGKLSDVFNWWIKFVKNCSIYLRKLQVILISGSTKDCKEKKKRVVAYFEGNHSFGHAKYTTKFIACEVMNFVVVVSIFNCSRTNVHNVKWFNPSASWGHNWFQSIRSSIFLVLDHVNRLIESMPRMRFIS